MKTLRVFALLLLAVSLHAQGLQPRHAEAQIIANNCDSIKNFALKGIVQKGDPIYAHVRWPADCPDDVCRPLPDHVPDSLGNEWDWDRSWCGLGLCRGPEYVEMRFLSKGGSVATGPDILHLPISCDVAPYEMSLWGFAENGTL